MEVYGTFWLHPHLLTQGPTKTSQRPAGTSGRTMRRSPQWCNRHVGGSSFFWETHEMVVVPWVSPLSLRSRASTGKSKMTVEMSPLGFPFEPQTVWCKLKKNTHDRQTSRLVHGPFRHKILGTGSDSFISGGSNGGAFRCFQSCFRNLEAQGTRQVPARSVVRFHTFFFSLCSKWLLPSSFCRSPQHSAHPFSSL